MLLQGDAANIPLANRSVHCCVTSPPYWGLRKYSGDQSAGEFPELGLEKTPEEYIERMVVIFREIYRVLRDDGVCFLNMGDCYAGSGGENANTGIGSGDRSGLYRNNPRSSRLQQGNLMLMPHRLAIALQDDGWIIRNDLIWYKRNPMPESVAGWRWERERKRTGNDPRGNEGEKRNATLGRPPQRDHDGPNFAYPEYEYGDDLILRKSSWRHTRAHEYVFQLTKQMGYWCNQEAVREAVLEASQKRALYGFQPIDGDEHNHYGNGFIRNGKPHQFSGRNPRSVLDVPTAPYSGAHYATFPPDLIAPLIRASCPRRCCPECGQGWSPVVEKGWYIHGKSTTGGRNRFSEGDDSGFTGSPVTTPANSVTDYRPTCECGHEDYIPGIVLDPFGGSGTTGMVAKRLMRRWVVMDLSRPYLDEQAKIRTGSGTPMNALDGLPLFEVNDAT